ncbi:MAG: hypothetical protein IPI78_18860 [Chitinophagaceae bacterium]|nr:hypothetical protein [Chitinophagaceae bacterium]
MAATLAIVSFSCTGPMPGTLLVGVADQGAWPLTAGDRVWYCVRICFWPVCHVSHGGLQSSKIWWLDDGCKSYSWFLELALAVKFFSNADLVKQWGLLKIFLSLWIVIGIIMVLYLLGKLRIAHIAHQ